MRTPHLRIGIRRKRHDVGKTRLLARRCRRPGATSIAPRRLA
jgi:hypothetical protein